MKATSKGFEITAICPGIISVSFDGETLRLDQTEIAGADRLSVDDATKVIEALTEARRLMTAVGTPVTSGPPRRLKDSSGDIWLLDDNGETYSYEGEQGGEYSNWTRAKLEERYSEITELPD